MRSVTLRIVAASNSVLWIAAELMKILPRYRSFFGLPGIPWFNFDAGSYAQVTHPAAFRFHRQDTRDTALSMPSQRRAGSVATPGNVASGLPFFRVA
jgi:hypothetical protein